MRHFENWISSLYVCSQKSFQATGKFWLIYFISNEFDGEVIKCINAGDGDQQNILTIKPPQNACLEILTFDSIVKSEATLHRMRIPKKLKACEITVSKNFYQQESDDEGENNG